MSIDEDLQWRERAAEPDCLASRAYLALYRQTYPDRLPGSHLRQENSIPHFMTQHVQQLTRASGYDPHRGDAVEVITDTDSLLLYQLEQGDLNKPQMECLFVVKKALFRASSKQHFAITPETDVLAISTPDNDLARRSVRDGLALLRGNVLQTGHLESGTTPSYIPSPCWSCPSKSCRSGKHPTLNQNRAAAKITLLHA